MKLIISGPQMDGKFSMKIADVTKAERQAIADLEGEEIEVSKKGQAVDAPDAQFNAWQTAQIDRHIAALQDMKARVEPYKPELFEGEK